MCYFVSDEPVADLIGANESTSRTEPEGMLNQAKVIKLFPKIGLADR